MRDPENMGAQLMLRRVDHEPREKLFDIVEQLGAVDRPI
jgi:hypothetical protein